MINYICIIQLTYSLTSDLKKYYLLLKIHKIKSKIDKIKSLSVLVSSIDYYKICDYNGKQIFI